MLALHTSLNMINEYTLFYCVSVLLLSYRGPLLVHNMCLVRPALLYFNVHVFKVFYEQINYYY